MVQWLDANGECSVDLLADHFGVSGMTIRRDLQDLTDDGQVIRTHGGATAATRVSFEFRFLERARQQAEEKKQIAKTALSLISHGNTVMLDSSTTTLAIARQLKTLNNITVITGSLPIASELFGQENVTVLLLGGVLRQNTPDLMGAITDSNLENLRADVAFIGADAIDAQGNLYNVSAEIGCMLARMANAATRVYATADHTKLDRHELYRYANLKDWDGLICDEKISSLFKQKLETHKIPIMLSSTKKAQHAGGRCS